MAHRARRSSRGGRRDRRPFDASRLAVERVPRRRRARWDGSLRRLRRAARAADRSGRAREAHADASVAHPPPCRSRPRQRRARRQRFGVEITSGSVETGGLRIESLATPGHSDDGVSFVVNGEVCFSGDTLFRDAVGGGPADEMRESVMDVLMKLPHEMRVLPGHTEETTIGREWEENPFIRFWRGLDEEDGRWCSVAGESRDGGRLVTRLRRQGKAARALRGRRRGGDRRRVARRRGLALALGPLGCGGRAGVVGTPLPRGWVAPARSVTNRRARRARRHGNARSLRVTIPCRRSTPVREGERGGQTPHRPGTRSGAWGQTPTSRRDMSVWDGRVARRASRRRPLHRSLHRTPQRVPAGGDAAAALQGGRLGAGPRRRGRVQAARTG